MVGHIYPVWLRFHGGKGVAVAAGVFSILSPHRHSIAARCSWLVWVDPVRLAGFDRGDVGTAADRLVGWRPPARGRRCRGHRGADSVPASRQPSPASARHRTTRGSTGMSRDCDPGRGKLGYGSRSSPRARRTRCSASGRATTRSSTEMIARPANPRYLADVALPYGVGATSSMPAALQDAQFVVLAVPSHGLRAVVRAARRGCRRARSLSARPRGSKGIRCGACRR